MDNISHQDQGEPTLGLQDTEKYKTSSIGLILGLVPVTAQHKRVLLEVSLTRHLSQSWCQRIKAATPEPDALEKELQLPLFFHQGMS